MVDDKPRTGPPVGTSGLGTREDSEARSPLATFAVGEWTCYVVSDDSAALSTWDQFPVEVESVGALTINGKQYRVYAGNGCGREERSLARLPVDVLTPRELQIALLVAQGRINKQIAYQLNLSEWTVSSYLRRVYAKLGVRTRAAMVAKIMRSTT